MRALNLTLISILTLSLFASCEKKSIDIVASTNIRVFDEQGKNLLSSPAVYDESNIEVYYIINGKAVLFNKPNYDDAKGFRILKNAQGDEELIVHLDFTRNEPSALTLIKLGDTKIDTIKADFKFIEGSVFCEQVWFNGVPKPINFNIVK